MIAFLKLDLYANVSALPSREYRYNIQDCL